MASNISRKDIIKKDPRLNNRPYQIDAIENIMKYKKCIVKMFCGTGKSIVLINTIIHSKQNLSVIVFPSLALINQFSSDYIHNDKYSKHFKRDKIINVSSETLDNVESTTDVKKIKKFLQYKVPKIVLVTYQSYDVLLNSLENTKIGLVCYDEAHHVVGIECQKLVFGKDIYEKEVFFTATPKNENNIIMYDRDYPEKGMCGPLAYEYTYLQGLKEEFLNGFDLCIDMYTEDKPSSIYEAICRAIIKHGTNRCLTFHSGVNGENNTSLWNFVKYEELQSAFNKVLQEEFPKEDYSDKHNYYKKITFKGMDGKTPALERKKMLQELDETPDNEIYIISSCETIGEGVDTKKANMCVFVDPKTSITKIIQNIGRVVRRNNDCPMSVCLIPCFIDMNNYSSVGDDKEKKDELIRQQMRSSNGDYAPITNVLAALKQEDPDLFEACLNYPNRRFKEQSLNDQGFMIDDENENHTKEEVNEMKENGEIPLEIHNNEIIERFNQDIVDEPLKRLYYDEEEDLYKPVIRMNENAEDDINVDNDDNDRQVLEPPNPKKRVNLNIHQNSDIQLLWGVKDEIDFTKKFCSVIIDCQVSYNIEQWKVNFEKSKAYIDTNEKRPSQHSNDKNIRKLALWISTQNANYKIEINQCRQIMKNNEIYNLWTNFINDIKYKEYFIDNIEKWKKQWRLNLMKVIEYIIKNKKRPAQNSWIQNQKYNYNINIHKSRGIMRFEDIHSLWTNFMNEYEEYFNDNIERWKIKFQCLKQYMDDNKKRPSKTDINKDTKKLGDWVCLNISYYDKDISNCKYIMNKLEVHNLWSSLLTNLLYYNYLYNDTKIEWKNNLELIKQYIDIHHRKPRKNSEQKTLANWIGTQNKIYDVDISKCKQIMKNEEIHKLWTDFINDPKYSKLMATRKRTSKKKQADLTSDVSSNASVSDSESVSDNSVSDEIEEVSNNNVNDAIVSKAASQIGELHKTYLRMRSDNLNQKFKNNPQLWIDYHNIRKQTFASYDPSSIPCNHIINELDKIKTKRQKIVVDMGCGQAPIAHYFKSKKDNRFVFYNYDHQSGGDEIISEVDISTIPLEDDSVEIAIISLALWGTNDNCSQYIKEAFRILETGGRFYISDSTNKWSPENYTKENAGLILKTLLIDNGFKIVKENIGKPFCHFECLKE